MNDIILSTNGLTKRFGSKVAVDHVSLNIRKGEIFGFIGRNGAGKTTFMRMVSGMTTPTGGEIHIFGEAASPRMFSRIGALIEAPGLYPSLTAYDNLRLKAICTGIRKPGYIENLLQLVGLSDVTHKKTGKFSLGMKQRLGIAMALVGEPDLLVLDEPINGLDPQGIIEVRDTISRLNQERGITVMISSHILEELSKIATNYGIINNGTLIAEMSREELLAQCCERIVLRTTVPDRACPVLDKLGYGSYKVIDSETIHVFEKPEAVAELVPALAAAQIPVLGVSAENESLEDFYIHLTDGGAKHA